MAGEITLNASMVYSDDEDTEIPMDVADLLANISTKLVFRGKQNVGTSEEAIKLGDVTTPAWAMFINRDLTNYIELKVATGGAIFAKMLAGEFCFLRLGSGAQAPYAIANSAACQMDIFILNL